MTSNDLNKWKMFQLWVYVYQTKASNPGNTVEATNPVFDLLMTSNDLQIENVFIRIYVNESKARNPDNTVVLSSLIYLDCFNQ